MSRNEAAERLRKRTTLRVEHELIDEALAIERRLTVEKVRAESKRLAIHISPDMAMLLANLATRTRCAGRRFEPNGH